MCMHIALYKSQLGKCCTTYSVFMSNDEKPVGNKTNWKKDGKQSNKVSKVREVR